MLSWFMVLEVSVCDHLAHSLGGLCLGSPGSQSWRPLCLWSPDSQSWRSLPVITWLMVLQASVCDYLVHGLGGLCLWPASSGASSLRWSRASWLKVVQKWSFLPYKARPWLETRHVCPGHIPSDPLSVFPTHAHCLFWSWVHQLLNTLIRAEPSWLNPFSKAMPPTLPLIHGPSSNIR